MPATCVRFHHTLEPLLTSAVSPGLFHFSGFIFYLTLKPDKSISMVHIMVTVPSVSHVATNPSPL